ncbi:MAG: hypothetical protein H6742_07190 [Alphaproteobacteria bacterium]|nr:hypothetical protein [Alphaproteobacteria bacterium]
MRRAGAALLLLSACGPSGEPGPPAQESRLVVEHATLEAGEGLVLRAAQAQVDDLGAGTAQTVDATVRGQGDAPPLEIEAPRSRWDLATRVVVFEGGVQATRADVVLTCETLTVRYATADRVERAVAEGDVVVRRGDRRATGARAELVADSGEVTLTGAPLLQEGPNTLRGERIVLFLDDEKVTCDACRLVVAGDAVAPR